MNTVKVISFILSNLLFLFNSVYSQIAFQKAFETTSGHFTSIVITPDNGYAIAGIGTNNVLFMKADTTGEIELDLKYSADSISFTHFITNIGFLRVNDGGYLIGTSKRHWESDFDMSIVKIDSVGNFVWAKDYGGLGDDLLTSLQPTNDGNFIILGTTESFSNDNDTYIIKLDSKGDTIWTKVYGGNNFNFSFDIKPTNDGGFIITGLTSAVPGLMLAKLDSIGNISWSKAYGGDSWNDGFKVIQTKDLGYAVLGNTESFGAGADKPDFYLIKTDYYGNLLWSKIYGRDSSDKGWSLKIAHDGGYILLGDSKDPVSGNKDTYAIKTDSNGTIKWSKTYGGNGDETFQDIQLTADSGYVFSGYFSEQYESYIIKTNAKGNSGNCNENNINTHEYSVSTIVYNYSLSRISGSTIVTDFVLNVSNGDIKDSVLCYSPNCISPIPNFFYSDSGFTIYIKELSAFAESYLWDFGDGNTDTIQNPIHTYRDSTATYNVCLTVSNSCGINTFCDSVNILRSYYPMLSDSSYWYVVETPGHYYLPNTEILQTYNKVQIDSVSYFEILSYTSRTWASPIVDTVYLREDNNKRKVYLKYSKSDSERVIYDFLLQVGDSIYLDFYNTYYDNAMYSSSWFYVDSIKNKSFESIYRNVWYLNNHSDSASIKWIEGIGSTISPVYTNESFKVLKEWAYPLFPDFNGSNMLLTCKYNGILQEYFYENADTCFYDLGNGIGNINLTSNINIYPNPNSGMFTVEVEMQARTEFQIHLTNIIGQIFYSESVNASFYKKDIDLSGYAKGVYTLKVVSDYGVVCRKVVYR